MRAEFTMTVRRHGITHTTKGHVLQGSGGRYRIEYVLPKESRGRIVTSDGQTNWQYEPGKNLLARTQLIPENAQNERDTEDLISQNYRIILVSDQERIVGRAAYLLELLPRLPGKSSQQRWIDRQTFKTLRIETHYTDGILARMIAYDHPILPAQTSPSDFQLPKILTKVSVDASTASEVIQTHNLSSYARALGLKADSILGFRLTQVASSPLAKDKTANLFYTDGIESISVFVQNGGPPISPTSSAWHAVVINNQTAFENLDGHLDAVVWSGGGHRYTAVSHLEPAALQQFVGSQMKN